MSDDDWKHRDMQRDLRDARVRHAQFVIAELYYADGWGVEIRELRVAERAADHEQFADDGDILLSRHDLPDQRLVEVKYKKDLRFSCLAEFHFEQILIGRVAKIDRLVRMYGHDRILAHYMVSCDFRNAAVVQHASWPRWFKKELFMSNTQNMEWQYCAKPEEITFIELPRPLVEILKAPAPIPRKVERSATLNEQLSFYRMWRKP